MDKALIVYFAGFLASQDADLLTLYYGQPEAQRTVTDTMFAASASYHCVMIGRPEQAQASMGCLSKQALSGLESIVKDKKMLQLPLNFKKQAISAYMLRKPNDRFKSVSYAANIVKRILQQGVAPDTKVIRTLISSSVRTKQVKSIAFVYATAHQSMDIPIEVMSKLEIRRAEINGLQPRLHCDVLGSLVRSENLSSALIVARGMRSRLLYHLLLSMWNSSWPAKWKGTIEIAADLLRTVDKKLLHATHHLAVSSIVLAPRKYSSEAKEAVHHALNLHRILAPQLEQPSISLIKRLTRTAIREGMYLHALAVFRETEARKGWCIRRASLANRSIRAMLDEALAQEESVEAIVDLTKACIDNPGNMEDYFYATILSSLISNSKIYRWDRQEQMRIAKAVVRSMYRFHIPHPPSDIYASMYFWALLGQREKTFNYFKQLSNQDRNSVAWGIYMLAFVRAGDTDGTLDVLMQAGKWFNHIDEDREESIGKTSKLVNMVVTEMIDRGYCRSVLTLLDMYITQSASEELVETAEDLHTLSPIIRVLLMDYRFIYAICDYSNVIKQYRISDGQLHSLLQACLVCEDSGNALHTAQKINEIGGSLSVHEWQTLIQISQNNLDHMFKAYRMWRQGSDINQTTCLSETSSQPMDVSGLTYPALYQLLLQTTQGNMRNRGSTFRFPQASLATPFVDRKGILLLLYRQLQKETRVFPVTEMRGKLRYNVRFVYELYRHLDPNDKSIPQLIHDGILQLQWLRSWRQM
ncbi:hypothetical protein IWW36_003064 [Coemansia brasiliensis]|uniref:Uncharacterized protein n=1 Tax=Coemansia brasiliensis TaxID=2650707 RepID=A0A9W8I611_9FUNG|nr:hypothetical protein IWW36_003064 [Coemansia brasiliensis]